MVTEQPPGYVDPIAKKHTSSCCGFVSFGGESKSGLLRTAEADILTVELIFGRAKIAAAYHCFPSAELPPGD
jgi:hypothetical protein